MALRLVQRLHLLGSMPLMAAALAAVPAHGQDSAETLETIIVTARKKAEPLQDTPVAVSAITADQLRDQGVVSLGDLAGLPNVSITATGSPGRAKMAIRGVSSTNADPFQAPAIALIVDGVYYDSTSAAIINAFDLESIEILRGPQGTLFGRNSPGGVINVRSRRPSDEFDFNAELTRGNYGLTDVRLGADIPLADTLNARLAVLRRESTDSPYDNLATTPVRFTTVGTTQIPQVSRLQSKLSNTLSDGETDIWMVRGTLDFKPSERLQVTLIADYLDDNSGPIPAKGTSEPPTPAAQLTPPGLPGGSDPYAGVNDLSGENPVETQTISLTIDYELADPLELTSITAYRDEKVFNSFDIDGEIGALLHSMQTWEVTQYTHESRLQSDFDGAFNFIVGGFAMYSELHKVQESFLSRDGLCLSSFGTTAPGPPPGACPIGGFAFNPGLGRFVGPFANYALNFNDTLQKTYSWALFGQAYVQLAERLRLTVGGRYSAEKKDFDVLVYAGQEAGRSVDESERWSNFSPMVSLDYKPTADTMVYGSISRAFRAGGFPGRASTIASWSVPFGEETVTAYEAGIKADLFDRKVRVNLTGFYSDYKDIQRETQVLVIGVGPENLILNAASATIKGVELELAARLTEQLTLHSNVAYQDGGYDAFTPTLRADQIAAENDVTAYISFPLPLTPEWTTMLGADYRVPLASGSEISLGATMNYTSQQTLGTVPIANGSNVREAVTLFDAYVSWRSSDEHWGARLWGRNLSDEVYILDGNFGGGISTSSTYAMPRTYGVTLSYDFR